MKKRIAAAVLCFVLTALFCSCGKYASVTVNSEKIDKGIYTYFNNRATAENPDGDSATVTAEADMKLARYVAVNSEFEKRGLTLDPAEKSAVSKAVDDDWHLFAAYYEGIGVSRQDYYKIKLNDAYEKKLMLNYYSENGDSPLSDADFKQYFSDHFVAFRTVTGFLTTVDEDNNAVPMTDEQKQAITASFNAVSADVNDNGSSIIDACAELQNVNVTEDIVVISENNAYPEGFYGKIRELENGKASAFVIGDYIFCAQRYEILSDEYNLFSKYRTDCLSSLKGEEFRAVVDSWASNYKVEH